MAVVLAALSAVFFGTADFAGGLASRRNAVPAVMLHSQIVGLAVVLIFAVLDGRSTFPGPRDLAWGAAAGLSGMVGLAFLYRGLARGYVSIVSPLAALLGAVVPVLFGLIGGERFTWTAGLGIVVSLPAIVLMSWHNNGMHGPRDRKRTFESWSDGALAGGMFGLFFICISLPAEQSGVWPLATARLSSVVAMALLIVVSRRRRRIRSHYPAVLTAGALDMAANIAFVLALRHGLLAIVTVVASAAPAQTVFLSRVFFGERVGAVRSMGIVMALVGVALMSLG